MEPSTEERLARVEEELRSIRERNARVETDKAWETSAFRVGFITAVIYAVAAVALSVIDDENALRNALVPALGYFLSVQSIPLLKKFWLVYFRKTGRK